MTAFLTWSCSIDTMAAWVVPPLEVTRWRSTSGASSDAAASSEAVLKTDDAGWLAVRPGAVFVAERFAAEGRPSDEFAVRIFVGALRMITGWVGRSNREGHRVLTPTATIGIRGTDHEPYVMTTELAESLAQTAGIEVAPHRAEPEIAHAADPQDIAERQRPEPQAKGDDGADRKQQQGVEGIAGAQLTAQIFKKHCPGSGQQRSQCATPGGLWLSGGAGWVGRLRAHSLFL